MGGAAATAEVVRDSGAGAILVPAIRRAPLSQPAWPGSADCSQIW